MSRVLVHPLNALGGGSPLITSFSDTFHRANVANLGPNWIYSSQPTALTQLHTTQYSVSGNTWKCQDATVNQTQNNSPECWIPFPIMNSAVDGVTQFSQVRFLTTNAGAGNDMRAGIVCNCGLNAAGDWQMYIFGIEVGLTYRLFKYSANAFVDIGGGNFGAPAANDVMRLSVTVGASNFVNAQVNGASIKTFTDNTPIITGWPGMTRYIWISGAVPPLTSFTFDNFSCGIGV